MRRALLAAAAAAALAAPAVAPILDAQQPAPAGERRAAERRIPRRLLFTAIGAAVGGVVAGTYVSASDDRNVTPGTCSAAACVLTFAVGGGAVVGYMIGREFDQLHALRYRTGAPLTPPSISAPVLGEAFVLAVRDSLIAVGGTAGVQLFRAGATALGEAGRRATGVRGISALAIAPGSGALVVGSPAGFYLYPAERGPGVLVRDGAALAAAAAPGRVYVATGSRIEVVPVTADTTRTWPGVDAGGRVHALAADEARGLLWAAVDSTLVALRPAGDSLERVGSLAIGVPARRLHVEGTRVALALGEGGVRLVDAADPGAPRERARWTAARFVYDVSLVGPRLYAAAGVEGVYVLDVSGTAPVTVGLARELGFATALTSDDGYTYLLDRSGSALRRIPSSF